MENKLLHLYAALVKEAARCELFGLRASQEQKTGMARLFKAISLSHTRQANRLMMQIRGTIGTSESNVLELLEEVLPQSIKHYESLEREANQQGCKAISIGMRHSRSVQLKNRSLLNKPAGNDPGTPYFVCNFCGFVASGSVPDRCSICTAPAGRFDRIGE